MKRHQSYILSFILVIAAATIIWAQNNKLTSKEVHWNQVELYADKNLPESALKEVEIILAQAKKEKNFPEIIKAMVYKMRFTLDKNPDETEKIIQEFEDYTNSVKNPVEKALMHSMTAELYLRYYQNDQYRINQRTDIQGFVPEDMKEWTKNIFIDKIVEHADLSLENPDLLKETNSLKYAAIIEQGEDSRTIQPTLFDFLSYREIELLKNFNEPLFKNKITEIYNQLIDFNKKKKNTPAVVYTELQKIDFENETKDENYLKKIELLEQQYTEDESLVEILVAKANYYLSVNNESDKRDNSRKKALDIVNEGLKKYPAYRRIGKLENIKAQLLQKSVQTDYKTTAKPGSRYKIKIVSNNIPSLQLSIFKINATALEYQIYRVNRRGEKQLYPNRTLMETRTISIKSDPDLNPVNSEIEITAGNYGIYEFVLEENNTSQIQEKAIGNFITTDFSFISRNSKLRTTEVFVLDRVSGNPVKDAVVKSYESRWNGSGYKINFLNENKTNTEGLASLKYKEDYGNHILVFEKKDDKYYTSNSDYYGNYYDITQNRNEEKATTALFTDRSLYRPGQTLYFKGIIYNRKKQEVVANEAAKIELYNVNGEKIAEKTRRTNEFGSFSGDLILPESGLNGAYRLQSGSNSINIWVEEYKRPTFEVTINRPKEEIRFGEEVKVTGEVKAYAGYLIPDASVKYHIVRRPHRFWWWNSQPEHIVANGVAKSDAEGTFQIVFIPEKSKNKDYGIFWRGGDDQFYTYTVYADVTDSKGETQQGEQTVSVGDKSLFIITDVSSKIDKEKSFTLDVSTQTLNGETIISQVKYSVIALQQPDVYYEEINDTSRLKELNTVLSGDFETKLKLTLDLKKLNSGLYKIVFTTKDNQGKEVKEEKRFILYDTTDKKPPVKIYSWMVPVKTEVNARETAQINFGTSTKNTSVLYELMQGNTILERRWIKFNDEIMAFNVYFKDTYGAGVTAVFTFVKDNKLFTQQVGISKKVEEKKLAPTISVFRDKLKPGEKAEWTINIPQTGDKRTAELLIGMYDASLDAIRPHDWNFNPTYREFIPLTPSWVFKGSEAENAYAWFDQQFRVFPEYDFDTLNWFDLPLGYGTRKGNTVLYNRMTKSSSKNETVLLETAVVEAKEVGSATLQNSKVVLQTDVQAKTLNQDETRPKVRENFNETAFFYPQLYTDKNGNVKVSFTAPESLTRWNVKMLAHTTDLFFGQEKKQTVTQKELMIQMNLPRFVRRSDKLTLTANVINMTGKPLTTSVNLEIINSEDKKPIALQYPQSRIVTLEPNSTKSVEWQLNELKNFNLVIAKVNAQSGNFSDGEQRYLPILPDKVLITESKAMTVRANQTRTFTFDSFINQLKNVDSKSFTVEFAGNPTWYAIQALPTLSQPANENAIDYMTAYYANKLASYIANANPEIAATFDKWKKAGEARNALLSNLEKNRELKNTLLEETPWVMDAKDETEQKRQIALLFDLNQQKNQTDKYLDKLLKFQAPGGGFSWFEKMPESRYITQEVLLNLARLNRMTKEKRSAKEKTMVEKALNYLDLMIARDFVELKKHNKDYYKQNVISNIQLFYLLTRSEYKDIPVAEAAKAAVEFYTAQSEKYWTDWTLYGKAMMATVAHRNNKDLVANDILKSLKENALQSDEIGMYWAKNTSGRWWDERPIAVQTAMLEAFSEITGNNKDADEMKIWLLKQKQTQCWDTPISTVDAIYALLNHGADWLSDIGSTTIKLGNISLKPQNTENGTAYFKEEIPVSTLKPDLGRITVSKKGSNGIGWGAVYWQYYQDPDKVKDQGKEMTISKKLYVEKINLGKKSIVPIVQTILHKGDKVITRLVLTTDRNLEFVVLKDLRAACFEPVDQTSGYQWRDGTGYYYSIKDTSTQYFFDFLPKGTYVFEHEVWVNNTGRFTSGITSVQCLYAPEFISHTSGEKILVE